MVSRRNFLTGGAAMVGGNLVGQTEAATSSGQSATPKKADPAQVDLFVGLSSVLTGYERKALAPLLDTLNLKTTYFNLVKEKIGDETTAALLNTFKRIAQLPPEQWPAQVKAQIMEGYGLSDPAKQIIKLWYTGIWYDSSGEAAIVSSDAYTKGLVWDTIQAHPMGYSDYSFGYWSKDPFPPGPIVGKKGERQ